MRSKDHDCVSAVAYDAARVEQLELTLGKLLFSRARSLLLKGTDLPADG